MTTIAYRDGKMACDSCHANGDMIVTRQIKIKRMASGALLGSAGDSDSRAVERLLDKIKRPDQLPMPRELVETRCDYRGILVFPPRRGATIASAKVYVIDIHKREKDSEWMGEAVEIPEGIAAAGSGGDFALVAMDCGKSAKEAVQYAIRRDINSCAPIHVMSLLTYEAPKHGNAARR